MKDRPDARARYLPRRLAAGQTAADDMNGLHTALVTKPGGPVNRAATMVVGRPNE
jgi:hypothetical protein